MLRGLDFIRFEAAEGRLRPQDNRSEVLRPWATTLGVASMARLPPSEAVSPIDASAVLKRRDELMGLLAVRPLSASTWLTLAAMAYFSGLPPTRVVELFSMSALVAPNEGLVMLQRGHLGLALWELLPQDYRRRTANDLAAVSGTIFWQAEAAHRDNVKRIVSSKSEQVRQEVRSELLLIDGVRLENLAQFGL